MKLLSLLPVLFLGGSLVAGCGQPPPGAAGAISTQGSGYPPKNQMRESPVQFGRGPATPFVSDEEAFPSERDPVRALATRILAQTPTYEPLPERRTKLDDRSALNREVIPAPAVDYAKTRHEMPQDQAGDASGPRKLLASKPSAVPLPNTKADRFKPPVLTPRVGEAPTTAPIAKGPGANHSIATGVPTTQPGAPKIAEITPHLSDVNQSGGTSMLTTDQDVLVRAIAKRLKESPQDLLAHLDYQLFRFLRGEPVPQMETMASLAPEDRELLTAYLDGLNNWRNTVQADPTVLMSKKVKPLIEMGYRVRNQAELGIPTLALCNKVFTFGSYDPVVQAFRAGQSQEVIIYCEVENFASRLNPQNFWETKLSMEAVLYTEAGEVKWKDKRPVPTDLSRNRRNDFFVVKRMILPKTLDAGQYILKVSIVDEQAQRVAEQTTAITMLAR